MIFGFLIHTPFNELGKRKMVVNMPRWGSRQLMVPIEEAIRRGGNGKWMPYIANRGYTINRMPSKNVFHY